MRSRVSNGHVLSDRQGVTAQDATGRLTTFGFQYDANNPGRPGFGPRHEGEPARRRRARVHL
ncbi:hypothetical protein ACRAWD_10705 [Caulobacter segnis]